MTNACRASPCKPLPPGLLDIRVELLVTFVVLTEELHFTRASERLYVSQSGLSRRLAALERCVGVELVDRTTRRVTLTAAGRTLLPHALALVDNVRAAAEALPSPRGPHPDSG